MAVRRKRQSYRVFRDDSDSDDAGELAHSWMVTVSNDGRRVMVMPCSPTKLAHVGDESDGWRTTLDTEIDWEVYADAAHDFDEPNCVESEVIVVKPAAKQYPTSDEPLREWVGYSGQSGYREEYLFEDTRLDGRCGAASEVCSCGESDENGPREHFYRCEV
ncbi:hypothetical protein BV22DRAFT_1135304 [Leucogyrophana mollusca]|uniref:Uncharacterized protein n=1 Tax=Leucogyrophana mollusca TaxID=85980 RepID=A0ACB8AVP6_9AGAM|nr:hypothetical protein BV22DRAFT_1135304 [Leucogyrophana mollusca]